MLILDPESGTFLYTRSRLPHVDWDSGNTTESTPRGTVVIQLWAPHDYLAAPFAVESWVDEWDAQAVMMSWIVDDQGDERELNLDAGDYDEMVAARLEAFGEGASEFHDLPLSARLTALTDLPSETPSAIIEGVHRRERARIAHAAGIADILNDAIGKIVWLRLFGGDAIGGRLKEAGSSGEVIWLEKPKRLGVKLTDWPNEQVRLWDIAAASVYEGRRLPKDLSSTGFGHFRDESDPPVSTQPQLWTALCPVCSQVIRPPWRSAGCWSCRAGKVRNAYFDVTEDSLLKLLEGRAEWQKLVASIEQEPAGCWQAAIKTPEGEFVRTPLSKLVATHDERREAIVELLVLAELEGFYLTPPEVPWATNPEWEPCGRIGDSEPHHNEP